MPEDRQRQHWLERLVTRERFVSIPGDEVATIIYGVLGLRTLPAYHAEPPGPESMSSAIGRGGMRA